MKKLTALTVSLFAVFAVNSGAFAASSEGLASGEWVDRYFVDFKNDWSDATPGAGQGIITGLSGDLATGTVKQTKMNIGEGLGNSSNSLKAVTDGNNIYINSGKKIAADSDTVTIPTGFEFTGTNTTISVPSTVTFQPTTGNVSISINSDVNVDGVSATGSIDDTNTKYTAVTNKAALCSGYGAVVNGECMKVYTAQSAQGSYNGSNTPTLGESNAQGGELVVDIEGTDNVVKHNILGAENLAELTASGNGTVSGVMTGGDVSISSTSNATIEIPGTVTATTKVYQVLVPHGKSGGSDSSSECTDMNSSRDCCNKLGGGRTWILIDGKYQCAYEQSNQVKTCQEPSNECCTATYGSGYTYDEKTKACVLATCTDDKCCTEKYGTTFTYNSRTKSCVLKEPAACDKTEQCTAIDKYTTCDTTNKVCIRA